MADESNDELQVQIQYALVEKLSNAQKRQAKLLELLDECIFECNNRLALTFTNPAWQTRLGYSCDELENMDLYTIIHSSTQRSLLDNCLSKLAQENNTKPAIIEVQLKLQNGQHHWFELRLVQDGDGGYIGSLFEIQQHKDIQAQLLHQQNYVRRLSLVASHTQNLVVITDREGRIEWVNKSFEERTGYSLKNIMGQKPGCLLQGKESDAQAIKQMSDALREGRSFQTDIINYNSNGEPYWVNINTSPVIDSTGNISHFIAVQTDITQSRAALSALKEAKYQAEQLSEAKSRFMANISHEIRTPLNAVIGSAEILLDSGLTREQSRFTQMIRTSSDALLSILDDVLTYSRFEAGKINISHDPFKLDRCLEEAIDIVSGTALEKGLSIILDIMPKVPLAIIGDKPRIRQILINLLANAVKFTHQGEVVVKVDYFEREDQLILQLSVQDTGIGIAEDKIDNMFEAFMQSDTSSTREYGGSGLGLAICRQICEAMGGEIRVQSILDVGSQFTVEFPLLVDPKICDSTAKIIKHRQYSHCWIVGQHHSLNPAVGNMLQHYGLTYSSFAKHTDLPHRVANNVDIILLTDPKQLVHCQEYLAMANQQMPRKVCLFSIDLQGKECGFIYDNQHEILLNGPFKLSHLSWALELIDDPDVNLNITSACNSALPSSLITKYNDKHVLIVEDNINNQVVLSQLLVQVGCKTSCVEHGQAAIDFLSTHNTDLILMDIQMPVMDGLTATEKIRSSREPYSQTPIVAVTANAIHGDKKRFIQAGMNQYLAKPINRDMLYEVLDRYLNPSHSTKRSKLDKLQYTLQQLSDL
jgi:PAS domain S-box-containing protein